MTYDSERSLLDPVVKYFRRKGYRWQRSEVGFYEYRLDLYCYSRVAGQTVAVELKLKKWRKAFRQALLYQLCADLVFVAVPASTVTNIDLDAFGEHGIGIVAVSRNGRCSTVLAAAQSDALNPEYRDSYVQYLMQGAPCLA